MKNKILTALSVIMALVPWSILPLRMYTQWALTYAHMIIPCYAAFMIFAGIYSILVYTVGNVKNPAMKACLVINSAYAMFGVAVTVLMLAQKCI